MSKIILAIDDEVDTLTFYSELLEDYKFTPITAENGIEGLKKAREEKPDLILLDIMMPKKSGMKTEVDFKNLLNRASTGKLPPEGHLTKPLTAENLIEEIRKVLG
jgi:DNA-binding response OmpR family regulator